MKTHHLLLASIGLAAGLASADLPIDTIQGHITANKTLDSGHVWIIKGRTSVDSPAVLTIEPGTTIKGQYSSQGTLAIRTGAKIVAAGTKAKPINFTSTEEKRGGWGGIVILGRAPTNEASKASGFEAVPEWSYGGDKADDSSGVLTYVTVNWPGFAVEVDKELNGITFCGVGNKTVVHHVQSNNGDDDGFEWFGGTVNVSNMVSTNQTDDGFDIDNGYNGTGKWMIQIQAKTAAQARHYYFYAPNGDTLKFPAGHPKEGWPHDTTYNENVGDNGIEASSNPTAGKLPQLDNKWSNVTVIDNGVSKGNLQLKENAGGHYDRMLLVGDSSSWAVSMLDLGTANNYLDPSGKLELKRTWLAGTFKTRWNVVDTSAIGKAAKAILDSTIKLADSALYKDLGPANSALKADSVGAIVGDDTANYWYKGWTLPGTVAYAKGLDRPASSGIARAARLSETISAFGWNSGTVKLVATMAAFADLRVRDVSGRVVAGLDQVRLARGDNSLVIPGYSALGGGLYFVTISVEGRAYSLKVIRTGNDAR